MHTDQAADGSRNAMNGIGYGRRSLCLAVLSAVSGFFLAPGCQRQDMPAAEAIRPIKTMVVAAGDQDHVRIFPGKVEASKEAVLAFRVPGVLVKLLVREGQKTAKGELIAQLRQDEFQARLTAMQGQLDQARANLRSLQSGDRPEERLRLEAQVRAAEAKLTNSRTDFERASRLLESGTVTQADYDRTQTLYHVAQEEYKVARQALKQGTVAREEDIDGQEAVVRGLEGQVVEANIHLADTTLLAPYDGVIAQRFVEQNQNVKAGEPIVRYQDVDEINVAVDVPETVMAADIRSAEVEQVLAEFSAAPGLQFPLQIREYAQQADPVTQTFRVRAAMKAPSGVKLLPGMTARVTVVYRRASVLGSTVLVPISAVVGQGASEAAVWLVGPERKVLRRPVKIGEATGGQIEVVNGLQPGDRIAVAGVTFLREGMKVRDLGDALGGGP